MGGGGGGHTDAAGLPLSRCRAAEASTAGAQHLLLSRMNYCDVTEEPDCCHTVRGCREDAAVYMSGCSVLGQRMKMRRRRLVGSVCACVHMSSRVLHLLVAVCLWRGQYRQLTNYRILQYSPV